MYLTNGSVAKVPDFTTAFREPDLQDKELNGFHAVLESGEHSCKVTLTRRNATLQVEVEPKRDQFVQESFMALKNWQNSVRSPRWLTFWMKTVELGVPHWLVWAVTCAISFLIIAQKAETTQIQSYRDVAHQLLCSKADEFGGAEKSSHRKQTFAQQMNEE